MTLISKLLPAILLVALPSAACKDRDQPEPSKSTPAPKKFVVHDVEQFQALCNGEQIEATGASYEKAPGKASPTVFLIRDPGKERYVVASWPALKSWQTSDVKDAQLVVCLDIVKGSKDHECKLQNNVLEQHSASMKLSVFEAKTGKKLGGEDLEVPAQQGCPSSRWFKSAREINYGDVGVLLANQTAAYQPTDAPVPEVPAWELSAACEGKPALGGIAPLVAPGSHNAFVQFLQEDASAPLYYNTDPLPGFISEWSDLNSKAYVGRDAKISLAFCARAKRGPKATECAFNGGVKLKVFPADWTITAVDPTTGKTLDTLNTKGAPSCPVSWDFNRGAETSARPPTAAVKAFMGKLVDPT